MCRRLHGGPLDPDVLLAYSTPRVVKIQDWRLGGLYYLCILGILGYVVGYTVVYNQRYRLMAVDLVGNARLQLRSPDTPYSLLPNASLFCGNETVAYPGPQAVPFQQLPCRYFDSYDAVYPTLEAGAMFVSTRITENVTQMPDGCDGQPLPACDYVSVNSTTYYIGDVEMMTLLVDHLFSSATLMITQSGLAMNGGVYDVTGKPVDPCDDYPQGACPTYVGVGQLRQKGRPDIVPLKTLLRAAGIASLDQQAGGSASMATETHRYAGVVLVVSLMYSNMLAQTGAWSQNVYTYRYTVQAVEDTEFKSEQVIPEPGSGAPQRRILDRHGVRILVKQAGTVGVFDGSTLLISLTASLGLLAVAATVVDLLATSCMPLRNIYAQYKMIRSVDFTDVSRLDADELARFSKEDLINPVPHVFRRVLRKHDHGGGGGGGDDDDDGHSSDGDVAHARKRGSEPSSRQPSDDTDAARPLLEQRADAPARQYGGAPVTSRVMAVGASSASINGATLAAVPPSDLRRGSGISLTTQQVRPLPPGPPPRSAATR